MKEEELLLFKEELAGIKEDRNALFGSAILISIWGLILLVFQLNIGNFESGKIVVVIFAAIGITCAILAELKYGRDYQDKLKELKKKEKNCNQERENMIISTTNTIEGMKIAKNLGYIEAKPSALSWNTRKSARENLEKKAEELGANAIINFKAQDLLGVGIGAFASGNVVIVEEIK